MPVIADRRHPADGPLRRPHARSQRFSLARSRPDFRSAAKARLSDERGVGLTVTGLLSIDAPSPVAVRVVPIERLHLHPRIDGHGDATTRASQDLQASIREHGVLSPILVRGLDGDRFQVLDGARRWRSARALGHTVVPVIVHELDDESAARLVELGRHGRPIPFSRLVGGAPRQGHARQPVVISGGDEAPSRHR